MYITDDPVADYDRYDTERAEEENRLPHCDYCGEPIHEKYYEIDGEIICEDCLDANFAKWVEN